MIIRIVKMTFIADKVDDFKAIFNISKSKIRNRDGCEHLELLNDIKHKNVFFTLSHWIAEEYLDNYRQSKLFKTTWSKTKQLFSEPPQAWSIVKVDEA